MGEVVTETFTEELATLTASILVANEIVTDEDTDTLLKELNLIIPVAAKELQPLVKSRNTEKLDTYLLDKVKNEYKKREKNIGRELWMNIVRAIFLSTIDKYWMDHLTAIEDLREGINLRGYAQLDPLVEYKNEAYSMFERLVGDINFEVTRRLFKMEINIGSPTPLISQEKPKEMVYKSASAVDTVAEARKTVPVSDEPAKITVRKVQNTKNPPPAPQEFGGIKFIPSGTKTDKKPGRNNPCWCGSGKKYKKCHYPN